MIQQLSQALDQGQPQSQPLAGIPLRIGRLKEFPEDECLLLRCDADAGVPYFDAHLVGRPTDANQDAAPLGVAHGIGDQIADHAEEKAWIAQDKKPCWTAAKPEPLGLGTAAVRRNHAFEQFVEDDGLQIGLGGAEIYAGNIKETVKQFPQ